MGANPICLCKLPWLIGPALALLAGLTAACGPTTQATATSTEEPAITATYTPSPTPTYTPSPTPTPTLEPLELGDFSCALEGYGSNGTIANCTYDGDAADLEKLTLTANISQGNKKIESSIPLKSADGKTFFEVVDAKYVSVVNPSDGMLVIPEDPIRLQINATSTEGRAISNNSQALDLGK